MGANGAAWAWTLQWGGFNTVSLLNTFASGFVACIVVLSACIFSSFHSLSLLSSSVLVRRLWVENSFRAVVQCQPSLA